MATSQFFTLKEAKLNNNCPECFSSDGLQLTYKQKFIETVFYKAITNETTRQMYCNTCNTEIFPVRWTKDIETVIDYQDRALETKPKSIKLKPLAWFLIVFALILAIGGILYATEIISFS